jgi:isoleucyl-tRNA synthetase
MSVYRDDELEARYGRLQKIRSEVSKQLEIARAEKRLGQSLEAKILLSVPDSDRELIESYKELLPAYFIVSQVELTDDIPQPQDAEHIPGLKLQVLKADGEKCDRCWNYSTSIGATEKHPTVCGRCAAALAAE